MKKSVNNTSNFTIEDGTTDKSGKACFIVRFNKRLTKEDFKTFAEHGKVFKAVVNGEFSPYNVSAKVLDRETLHSLLSGFKYTDKEPETVLKVVNKFSPKKTAKNDLKAEGIDPKLFAQFQAFLAMQKEFA